ncbi:MAG: prolipoprotein diacylglyceryl transferase [Spirochaetes bacterium]|nr:prolipoprotein diacylglyceryl transferase [Spirochaetota bacterium]
MRPVLFIIPKFGPWVMFLLVIVSSVLFLGIYFLLKRRVQDIKKLRKDLAGYAIFILAGIVALHFFAPVPIRTYGVAVAVGFLAALSVAMRMAKRVGIKAEYMLDFGVYVLVGIVLGSRLFYFLFYDLEYLLRAPWRFFALWEGGLVFYGGVVGAVITGVYYVKKKRLDMLKIIDIASVVALLGLFFGRWGCLGYGCCFGKVASSSFPCPITFPDKHFYGFTPAFEHQLLRGLVKSTDKFSLPVYPVQIMSSINALILFFILTWLYKRRKFDGQTAAFSLMFYAITRFLLEFLRVNPSWLGLTVSQWIGIVMLILGLVLYRLAKRKAGMN